MIRTFAGFCATAVLAAGLVAAAPARAEFPDRDIEFVVGYGASSGYAAWALALAPALERHLPGGKAKVVVRYMPGGGNVVATEYTTRARPDGHTIGIFNVFGLAGTQLVRKVKYDLSKMTWLGRVSVDNETGFVAKNSPIKTVEDIKKQTKPQYILSTQGLASTGTIAAAVLFERMGIKWKPLNHDDLGAATLAVIRGDADMYFGTYESTQSYVDNGDLRPIVYYDDERHPKFPNVPRPGDLGYVDLNSMNPHRLIGGPPGTPAPIAKTLETALRKAITEDAGFKEQVAKMKKTIQYADGAQSAKIVAQTLDTYTRYESTVKNLMGTK